ncbi:MAG: hypothetical protein AAB362_03565 [Patescibacteria group bacterium]
MRNERPCLRKKLQAFLRCEVFDGMFSDEYGVEAIDHDGNSVSGFFVKGIIDKEKQRMAVEIANEESGSYLVWAPGQSCGGKGWINATKIWVPKTMVVFE